MGRSQTYSPEEVTRGLAALAVYDGSERAAARFLEQTGKPIPFRTLHDWKTTRAERYAEVREQELPAIRQRHIHETEELVGQHLAVKKKLLAKVDKELDQLSAGQAASALKQVAISAGIDTDKSLLLRGEPTVIHGNVRDMDQLWTRLEELAGMAPAIDSTAIEEPDDVLELATDTAEADTAES